MLRVLASLIAVPVLLAVLLAGAIDLNEGSLGSLSRETFELGLLPIFLVIAAVMALVFLPLLLLTSRVAELSPWNVTAIGFVSALIPVVLGTWSFLTDTRLRLGFRAEGLAEAYPWLTLGAVGGLLFWLLAIFRNRSLGRQSRIRQ
jgi:cytochrome c biogenesis protein CcdA